MFPGKLSKELILYLVTGVLTTLVNFVCYFVLKAFLSPTVSTVVAWFTAVLFAYITNRIFVFDSRAGTFCAFLIQIVSFFLARLLSGIFDIGATYIFIEKLGYNDLIVKISINIVVIVFNYLASKFFIFRKKKH